MSQARHGSSSAGGTLEQQLRQSIEEHMQIYRQQVEPRTRAAGLSRIKLYDFIIHRDRSLQRRKRVLVEKAIDALCRDLDTEEAGQKLADVTLIESDNDESHAHDNSLRDGRGMNELITSTWEAKMNKGPGESSILGSGMSATSMSKRRALSDATRKTAKRNKAREDHLPMSFVSLQSLGGIDDCIEEVLETIVMPLRHPSIYTRIGISTPRGVLLHGPPGCGKTLLANAVAGEVGVPFISVSAPAIVSGMSGESERKLRDIFEEARSLAPAILFIDEIDAVTPKRESAQREMERRIVAQLLTCMDDLSLEKTDGKPVIVIGATNRPDSLDAALRRAGRFDREICLGVPSEEARVKILNVLTAGLKLANDVDLIELAKATPGYVGADIKALLAAAGVATIKRMLHKFAMIPGPPSGETWDSAMTDDGNSSAKAQPSGHDMFRRFVLEEGHHLTDEEIESVCIDKTDFDAALKLVQPSSKREGFTTVPNVSWTDIGALETIRGELQMAIVQPIRRPELYRQVGISAPAGVLLWGPPGCGKTLLAKAVANESKANFVSIRGPELLNKYVGESERAMRQVFARARASVPCIIFFDELDALVPKRDDALSESSARLVNTLLTELDGLEDRNGIFVIAATNRPDIIDPAMLRPGRLDKPLFVSLPSVDERHEILQTLSRKTPLSDDVDLNLIARDERCANYSGADLAALVREASVTALRRMVFDSSYEVTSNETVTVTSCDFENALITVRPSVSDVQRHSYESLRRHYS
ncbi:Ribosome bioproteinsis ATPase rix7 [Savitreella phatthalungensis]